MASQSSAPRYPQDSNTSYPPAARPPPTTWDGFSHDPDLALSAAPSGLRSYPSYLSTASSSSPYPDALTNLGYPSFSSDPRPLPAARTTSSLGGESDPEKDDAPHFREVAIEDDGYNHPASSHGFHSGGKGESVGEHARRKMTLRRAVGEAAGGATRGGWRKIIPSTLVTRLYIGLVALQTVVDMAIQVSSARAKFGSESLVADFSSARRLTVLCRRLSRVICSFNISLSTRPVPSRHTRMLRHCVCPSSESHSAFPYHACRR